MHVDSGVCHPVAGIGGPELGRGKLFARFQMFGHHPGGLQGGQLESTDIDVGVGEPLRDSLERPDRPAELFALATVVCREFQSPFEHPGLLGAQGQSHPVAEKGDRSGAGGSEHAGAIDPDPVEFHCVAGCQPGGRGGCDGDTRGRGIHHEHHNSLGALRVDHHGIGDFGVWHIHFEASKNPVVSLGGGRGDRLEWVVGEILIERHRDQLLTRHQIRQPLLLEGVGPELGDGGDRGDGNRSEGDRGQNSAEFFGHRHVVDDGEPRATDLFGEFDSE